MNFDGVILDIDGTLWDVTPISAESWNRALRDAGVPEYANVTHQILKHEFGKTMSQISEDIFPGLNGKRYEKFLELRAKYENDDIATAATDVSYKGVRQTLEKCIESMPVKFYVVSNCRTGYVELMSQKLGIEKYITDFECFGNTKKPKAENICTVIARNNITKPLYVGDTQGDCDACAEANVPFVWASYGYGKASSYYAKLDSFCELEKIIS